MSVGSNPTQGVIGQAWGEYTRHWQHFVGMALVVYVIVSLVSLLLVALGWVGAVLAAVLSLIGVFWLQGAYVKAVEDIRDGRADLSIGETFSAVRPFIARIAGASVLAGLGIGIGLILLIVPGLILLTIWAVIIPALVLENLKALDSFRRSQQLVSGYGMNVFGVIALTFLIMLAAGIVLGAVLAFLPEGGRGFISDLVTGVVIGPFVALVWTLLYFRLRDVKGGAPTGPAAPPPPAG